MNLPESDGIKAATPDDGTEEVRALELAQVIELQAFSDRKAWIEEKTRVNTMLRSPPARLSYDVYFLATGTVVPSRGVRWTGLPTLGFRNHQLRVTHQSKAPGLGRRMRQDRERDRDFRCRRVQEA